MHRNTQLKYIIYKMYSLFYPHQHYKWMTYSAGIDPQSLGVQHWNEYRWSPQGSLHLYPVPIVTCSSQRVWEREWCILYFCNLKSLSLSTLTAL